MSQFIWLLAGKPVFLFLLEKKIVQSHCVLIWLVLPYRVPFSTCLVKIRTVQWIFIKYTPFMNYCMTCTKKQKNNYLARIKLKWLFERLMIHHLNYFDALSSLKTAWVFKEYQIKIWKIHTDKNAYHAFPSYAWFQYKVFCTYRFPLHLIY